jgi:hypothetical protein
MAHAKDAWVDAASALDGEAEGAARHTGDEGAVVLDGDEREVVVGGLDDGFPVRGRGESPLVV